MRDKAQASPERSQAPGHERELPKEQATIWKKNEG